MKDLTWYQYFFTECRVIWDYLRLFLLPFGQNLDYDFPISRSVLEHGAIFGLIGLIAVSAAGVDLPAPFSAGFLRLVHISDSAGADLVVRADSRSHGGAPLVPALHRTALHHGGISAALEDSEGPH